jgi:hypothetical protein
MKNIFILVALLFQFELSRAATCTERLIANLPTSDEITIFNCGPSSCLAGYENHNDNMPYMRFMDLENKYSLDLKIKKDGVASGVTYKRSGQTQRYFVKAEYNTSVPVQSIKVSTVHSIIPRHHRDPRPPRVVGRYHYSCTAVQ